MVLKPRKRRRGFVLILLDTHALIWYRAGDSRLGQIARHAIDGALQANDAVVSAVSFWELGMLIQKRRFEFIDSLTEWRSDVLAGGLIELEIDGEIGLTAGLLSHSHGDPADRLIVATAICSGATLLTADATILRWSGAFNRQDAQV